MRREEVICDVCGRNIPPLEHRALYKRDVPTATATELCYECIKAVDDLLAERKRKATL